MQQPTALEYCWFHDACLEEILTSDLNNDCSVFTYDEDYYQMENGSFAPHRSNIQNLFGSVPTLESSASKATPPHSEFLVRFHVICFETAHRSTMMMFLNNFHFQFLTISYGGRSSQHNEMKCKSPIEQYLDHFIRMDTSEKYLPFYPSFSLVCKVMSLQSDPFCIKKPSLS